MTITDYGAAALKTIGRQQLADSNPAPSATYSLAEQGLHIYDSGTPIRVSILLYRGLPLVFIRLPSP
jgi:hypothetical protein